MFFNKILGPRNLIGKICLGLALFLFFGGCGRNSDSPIPASENKLSLPIPAGVILVTGSTLTAQVSVDGGAPISLTPVISGTQESLTLSVPAGTHTFTVNYFLNGIIIATATTSGTITAGGNTTLKIASYIYPDSDGDGWTNLAELNAGKDPLLASSHPSAETPRVSAKYVMADNPPLSSSIGRAASASYAELGEPSLIGQVKSANYTINPGF